MIWRTGLLGPVGWVALEDGGEGTIFPELLGGGEAVAIDEGRGVRTKALPEVGC